MDAVAMNSKVVQLHEVDIGFDFDALFEGLKGDTYDQVLVITDSIDWYGNVNVGDALLLMERLRLKLAKEATE
jgi:hypothetical protein